MVPIVSVSQGLADRVPGRLGRGEGGARLGQQHAADVGQRDPVPVAVEQDRLEFVLQGPYRAGNPGLHHMQPFGRAGEAPRVRNGFGASFRG